ncbi:Transcription factor GTE5 [Hirschfeldia incana]|nr:Transcription factor GTE5 [Hirschfeldia incana]KAJ0247880.1 Transcription factor GTE5 [Hirschfeldia incana]
MCLFPLISRGDKARAFKRVSLRNSRELCATLPLGFSSSAKSTAIWVLKLLSFNLNPPPIRRPISSPPTPKTLRETLIGMSSDQGGVGGAASKKKKKNHHNKPSQNRSKPMAIPRPNRSVPLPFPSNSLASEEDEYPMLKVSLSSISKLEVRNLKRKLTSELDQVRSLITRFFSSDGPHQNKKTKTGNSNNEKGNVQIFKSCSALLTKLMKHKDGWVFNVPVDAKVLGLHDYHTIVKEPMDLGTVKGKLGSGLYDSPLDFAEDVRLTFNNAILYNPVGHEVHSMAKLLLNMFEEKWVSIEVQFHNLNRKVKPTRDVAAFSRPVAAPPVVEALPPPSLRPTVFEDRTLERAESMTTPVEPEAVTTTTTLEKPEEEEEEEAGVNVRDLTMDEKRRLSEELQDLPYDKLETVVQIIKKSNPELSQQDDEIELDIDSVDVQTLWELYRFVIGYKESLSSKKEDQGFGSERDAESVHDSIQEPTTLATGTETSRVNESGKAIRMSSPGRQSSSSNSSSSDTGSGSSDSDSDSSSGHGSDTGN